MFRFPFSFIFFLIIMHLIISTLVERVKTKSLAFIFYLFFFNMQWKYLVEMQCESHAKCAAMHFCNYPETNENF